MQSRGQSNKHKMRTLCTIDTTDIDLYDARKKQRSSCKNNNKNYAIMALSNKSNVNGSASNFHKAGSRDFFKNVKQSHSKSKQKMHKITKSSCNMGNKYQQQKLAKANQANLRRISKPKQIKNDSQNQRSHLDSSIQENCFNNYIIHETVNGRDIRKKSQQKIQKISKDPFCKTRMKTEHSNISDKSLHKSTNKKKHRGNTAQSSKKQTTIKKQCLYSTDFVFYPIDQKYRIDFYEIVRTYPTPDNQIIQLVKLPSPKSEFQQPFQKKNKQDKLYLLKKTKDKQLKKLYKKQIKIRERIFQEDYQAIQSQSYKNITFKHPKNLVKLQKHYRDKNWIYLLYEHAGHFIDWEQNAHQQIVRKIIKDEGIALKHIIKQVTKGIYQLARRGFTHSSISIDNILMHIFQNKKTVKLQGNIKLTNLKDCFHFSEKKTKLLEFAHNIYTPPEIINYIMQKFEINNRFQTHNNCEQYYYTDNLKSMAKQKSLEYVQQKFDRDLIEYIGYYDEPWYCDIWALGIVILELLAGQPISVSKLYSEHKQEFTVDNARYHKQNSVSVIVEKQNNLQDISISLQKQPQNICQIDESSAKKQHKTDIRLNDDEISLSDILYAQKNLLIQTEHLIQMLSFNQKLQGLVIRMLSLNPLVRPTPKQIIASL